MDRLPRGLGGVAHAATCHPHGPMHSLPLSNSPPPSTCCQGHEQGLHPTWSPGGSRDHHISTQGLASPCPESSGPTPLCPFFPSMASPPDSFPSPLCAHRGLSKMVPESPGPHLDCPLPGHAPRARPHPQHTCSRPAGHTLLCAHSPRAARRRCTQALPGPSARESWRPPTWPLATPALPPWSHQPQPHPEWAPPVTDTQACSGHHLMPRPRVPPTFPSAASHFPHHHPGGPLAKCPKFKWILGPPTAHVLHPPARAQLPPWRTLSPCGCAVWPLWKTRLPPEPPWSPSHRFSKTHCLPAKPVLQPSEEGSQRPGWPVSLGLPGDLPSSMAASALTAVQVLSCWQRVPVELPADGRCLLCLGPSCSSGGHAVMSGLGEHHVCPQGSGHAAPPHIPPGNDAAPAP